MPKTAVTLPTWINVIIGAVPKSLKPFEAALRKKRVQVSPRAAAIIHHPDFSISPVLQEVDLVRLAVGRELEFFKGAPLGEVINRGVNDMGLQLCPIEVAPRALIRHRRSSFRSGHEFGRVAMKPVQTDFSSGSLVVFDIELIQKQKILMTSTGDNNFFCLPHVRIIFASYIGDLRSPNLQLRAQPLLVTLRAPHPTSLEAGLRYSMI